MKYSISTGEYSRRIGLVKKSLVKRKLDALYLTNGTSMYYLTGYSFISTERPAALVVPVDGKVTFFGPMLEKDHVPLETSLIEDVRTYMDYPGKKHPIEYFADFLKDMNLVNRCIGTDNPMGALRMWGYEGPSLAKTLRDTRFVDAADLVAKMRLVKSQEEIELMKESAKWANLALALMQEYTQEGVWDVDVALSAAHETSLIMKKTLGSDYVPRRSIFPVAAVFRGQIGEMSAIPHSMATNRMIRKGDVVIAEVGVDVGGYTCELERTMIVGEPTAKQKRLFNVMVNAQEAAFKTFRAGAKCSEIDEAAISVFRKAGLIDLVRHHCGHGLGLEGHEPPWLDTGNSEILYTGTIVSCEPGIYEVGFAGFRHSDTVLTTENGSEILTYYPRDLDSLIV